MSDPIPLDRHVMSTRFPSSFISFVSCILGRHDTDAATIAHRSAYAALAASAFFRLLRRRAARLSMATVEF
jgi:hypothetical protein